MILEQHNPKWFLEFERLKYVYVQTLGEFIVGIEHVGSTAVSGLMAKPIIDIDIVIQNYDVFPTITKRLGTLGYYHNGDQGVFQREAFKRRDAKVPYYTSERDWMLHHLYVCPEFSVELKRHILFRDVLKSDQQIRDQYEKMKTNIAERSGNDRKKYADIKEVECKDFIYSVINDAETGVYARHDII